MDNLIPNEEEAETEVEAEVGSKDKSEEESEEEVEEETENAGEEQDQEEISDYMIMVQGNIRRNNDCLEKLDLVSISKEVSILFINILVVLSY